MLKKFSTVTLSMKGGELMVLIHWLELVYKIIAILCGTVSFYISVRKIVKARKSKIKRNASKDVPK